MQFVKFGLVGFLNVLVSYFTYFVLTKLGMMYVLANVIAFFTGNLNSFIWSRKFVFNKDADLNKWYVVYLKQLISNAFTGVVLNNCLLIILVEFLQLNKMIAPLAVLIITVPINFFISKFWAYK